MRYTQNDVIRTRIGNLYLFRFGIEVCVPNLHGNAGGKLALFAQVEGDFLYHGNEHRLQSAYIRGIAFERAFRGD